MTPITSRTSRVIAPIMGARLLAPSSCRGSPRCTIAAAAAAARGISDKSGSSFPARVPTTGERRSLHKTAATTSPPAAAAVRAQDSGSSRRSLNTTARNLGVDPTVRGPKGLLPEFSLKDKVIVVSGGAQGLGLVQTEALLEAGALGM